MGGIKNVPDADSWSHIVDVDGGIERKAVSCPVGATDAVDASRVLVLPDAEVAVNEEVVQPEDGVGRRGKGILHDSSDTVMTPGVRSSLRALSHAGIIAKGVALVDVCLVAVGGLSAVTIARKTMDLVALAGTNVECEIGELLDAIVSGLLVQRVGTHLRHWLRSFH